MTNFIKAAAAVVIGFGATIAISPSAQAYDYYVRPSMMRNGGYHVDGPNGYSGSYRPSMMGNGGTYTDNYGSTTIRTSPFGW